MDSNHRPSGYEPDELPLLHAAPLDCRLLIVDCVPICNLQSAIGRVHGPTLPAGIPPVPLALPRFTTRFGMGRGGSTAPLAHHWLRGQHTGKCFRRLSLLPGCAVLRSAAHSQVFPQGSPRPCAPVACTCHHASSSGRLPSHLLGDLPAHTAVSVLILRRISHLDAFSGSCFRT
jgi:hypothetical protein